MVFGGPNIWYKLKFGLPAGFALNTSLVVTLVVGVDSAHVFALFTTLNFDVFMSGYNDTSGIGFAGTFLVA